MVGSPARPPDKLRRNSRRALSITPQQFASPKIKGAFPEPVSQAILVHAQDTGAPRGHGLPPKLLTLRITVLRFHRGILGTSKPRGYHDHQERSSPNGHACTGENPPYGILEGEGKTQVLKLILLGVPSPLDGLLRWAVNR
jgi:hypothetical protein